MARFSYRMFYWLWSKLYIKIFILFILIFIIISFKNKRTPIDESEYATQYPLLNEEDFDENADVEHATLIEEYFDQRNDYATLSELGKTMFLLEKYPRAKLDKKFKILIWRVGKRMAPRHIRRYTKKDYNPFQGCSVKNCIISYEDEDLDNADAVVFFLHTINSKKYDFPDPTKPRPSYQRWVFVSDEGQNNTFMYPGKKWYEYGGVFNWSMTYKMASDVPVPCGRTLPLVEHAGHLDSLSTAEQLDALVPFWEKKQRNVLLTSIMSACLHTTRLFYRTELEKFLEVDAFGKCGDEHLKKLCPFKGYGKLCPLIKNYIFYLSFHNCNCDEFVDEKVWSNAITTGGIPIIMGCKRSVCEKLLPPDSFIHVDDFESPEELAKFIIEFNNTFEDSMLKYHNWRKNFQVVPESGYSNSRSWHYCRLCEALNYNDPEPKVYDVDKLRYFLDPKTNCYMSRWQPRSEVDNV